MVILKKGKKKLLKKINQKRGSRRSRSRSRREESKISMMRSEPNFFFMKMKLKINYKKVRKIIEDINYIFLAISDNHFLISCVLFRFVLFCFVLHAIFRNF